MPHMLQDNTQHKIKFWGEQNMLYPICVNDLIKHYTYIYIPVNIFNISIGNERKYMHLH